MMTQEAILYYADHPADFVEDLLHVTPDKNQRAILDSVAKNQMTSVRSGHGIGKSAVEAWTVIWFMSTRPFPKIPCTAPTQHQLFDILWAEISKWLRNNKALERELMWTKEKVYMKQYPEEWFAVARTASKPDALQGFHADDILYIIDEASGVDDKVFEPVLGALSTPGARLLMCGNPTQLSGFFYDSHHKNRGSYTTFHVDGRNSSRVSDDFVKTIIQMYGEDSDVFRVRVAGEFPRQENDVFIPLPLVEKSIMTEWTEPTKPARIDIGCDVARYGDDRTVIGYKVDEKAMFYKRKSGQDLMQTADDIMELGLKLMEKYRFDKAIPIKIDDSGLGGGVTDRLLRKKTENTDDGYRSGVKHGKLEYACTPVRLPWEITEETLRENIEGSNYETIVTNLMTRQIGCDREDLCLNGDERYAKVKEFSSSETYAIGDLVAYNKKVYQYTAAHTAGAFDAGEATELGTVDDADFLKVNDGWVKQFKEGGHVVDVSGINSGAMVLDVFYKGLRAVPDKFNNGSLRWLMSPHRRQEWERYILNQAVTAGGIITDKRVENPASVPVIEVPALPDDVIMLTDPKNLVVVNSYGVVIRKTTEGPEAIYQDKRFYVVHFDFDTLVEELDATAIVTGLASI